MVDYAALRFIWNSTELGPEVIIINHAIIFTDRNQSWQVHDLVEAEITALEKMQKLVYIPARDTGRHMGSIPDEAIGFFD
jgi:hypothetical protein